MEHLIDVSEPHGEFIDSLQVLLEQKFVLWLELSACKWQSVIIKPLIEWVEVSLPLILWFKASNEYIIIDLVHPSSERYLCWRACISIHSNQLSSWK